MRPKEALWLAKQLRRTYSPADARSKANRLTRPENGSTAAGRHAAFAFCTQAPDQDKPQKTWSQDEWKERGTPSIRHAPAKAARRYKLALHSTSTCRGAFRRAV
jgi:hypothetical protein